MNDLKFPLKKRSPKRTDFDHHKTFGVFPIDQLPEEYLLISTILDQDGTYKCSANSASAVQESQHEIRFNPDDFFEAEGVISGNPDPQGYDIETILKTGVKYGFKPLAGGDPANYREGGYFFIDKVGDLYDGVRVALYLAKDEKKTAITGLAWKDEWTFADKGVVPDNAKNYVGGHAIKIAGWTKKNGVEYLVLQNSYGTSYGDNGLYYFSRSVVNKEFKGYGVALWRTKPEEVKRIGLITSILQNIQYVIMLISELVKKKPTEEIKTLDEITVPEIIEEKYKWATPAEACHSVRLICDEEGLSVSDKNLIAQVINCESQFNIHAKNENKDKNGNLLSTDWGICQMNDYWYSKLITPDEALNNPEKAVRLMIHVFQGKYKGYHLGNWVCYSTQKFLNYPSKIV